VLKLGITLLSEGFSMVNLVIPIIFSYLEVKWHCSNTKYISKYKYNIK